MVIAGEDLSRFRYHTGAPLRPLAPDTHCPFLFRDLGTVALARYLRGELTRLAGPTTPLLYMRTVQYREPYLDHEDTGRIVFLRPAELAPWHSGVTHIFVARATRTASPDSVGFAPPGVPLADVERKARDVREARELREALGGRLHDEARAEALHRLERLNHELHAMEAFAEPLRRAFQSADTRQRAAARAELARRGISETDLCCAWHHIPRARRAELRELLPTVNLAAIGAGR